MSEKKVDQRKCECLMLAIAKINGSNNPEAESFSINNPLMVRSFAKPGKHPITDAGVRVFPSILAGMKAGLFDLEVKIKGQSRAQLKPENTVSDLLSCYNVRHKQAVDSVIAFLRRALKDESLKSTTALSYFICMETVQEEVNAGQ
jgi:hypothetical protein